MKNETKYSDYDFTYYLEKLVTIPDHDRLILFLHANIDDISFCRINDIRNIVFYHDHCIISENDAELIDQLKNRHLMKCEYSLIKQLNLICLFFDITRKSAVLSSLPIHIQMEHTTFCNARCVMCDHFIAHNRGSRHLQLSSIKAMESVLPYASLIIMHGNGEPLINPNIIGIFEIYKKYGIKTSLNTNLSYLTDDILSYLSDNCASIHVSCDGLGEKQYESIRLGLPYSNFLNNLKRLALSCGQTEKVLEVVLMRQNLTNAPAFVRFAHEYGFSKVIFNTLGCNQWIGNEKDGLSNFQSAAVYYCSLAKNEGIFLGITVVTPFEYLQDVNNGFNTDDFSSSDCFPGPDYSNYLHEK